MEHKISIPFYGKTNRTKKGNLLPLYMRITINGQRIEQTIQRYVDPLHWSVSAGRMIGKSPEAKTINNHLNLLASKVHDTEKELLQTGKTVTYQSFKDNWVWRRRKAVYAAGDFPTTQRTGKGSGR